MYFIVNYTPRDFLVQNSYHKQEVENEDRILENPSQDIGNTAATTHIALIYALCCLKEAFFLSLPIRRTTGY